MEASFLLWLQNLRNSLPDFITVFFTQLTNAIGGAALIVVIAVVFWCVSKRGGYLMVATYATSISINQLLKNTVCMNRPWILDSRIVPEESVVSGATGYSFPSGHTNTAASSLGALALWQRSRPWIVAVALALILLTGLSRMWLGVHMPKDILTALLIAAVMVFAVNRAAKLVDEHPTWDIPLAAIMVAFGVAALAFCALKGYPLEYDATGALLVDPEEMKTDCFSSCGFLIGFAISWVVERRFVKFTVDGSTCTRIIRALGGIVVVAAVYVLVPLALTSIIGVHWTHFIKYALLIGVSVVGYPAVFMYIRARRDRVAN